ncbi:mannitol dehydrogenase family protein [uncultured Microbacterium sp.]|uniref:mannitol dehydrogenase family protein n=1 Tax=uncultured Microbacterium sp. TaxID=191216 RepID=UPI0035CB5522
MSADSEATKNEPIVAINYDRSAVQVGIVHFGVGNFHRSHEAMYVDKLLRAGGSKEWGICGVGVLPSDTRMREALRGQALEYTLVERHPDGSTPATRIGSIVEYLSAPTELESVLERLADPATRIVSLTITEGGYNISDATGLFDTTTPAIIADAVPGAIPSTVFGIVLAGLQLRRDRGTAPFTIMSCDNIEENGNVARASFCAFAGLIDRELGEWVAHEVRFPNSMVDRITPVTTDADRDWVHNRFGVDDAWPVLSEGFEQWVLEDDFPLGRPTWEEVGVQLVQDVRPYELMKLRLLNGSHQAMAYFGILAGHTYVQEAATDRDIVTLLTRFMSDEAELTLDPVPGVSLDEYKRQLIERFANPYVGDTLSRLATDASDRIPKFVVPIARSLIASGKPAALCAAVIASWAAYATMYVDGEPLPFRDRQEPAVRNAVELQRTEPNGFLRNRDWFGDLADDEQFADDFARTFIALTSGEGATRNALRRLIAAR